jgi:hypothetical protein
MMRWEIRYSSCEMLYLEINGRRVHSYLDHSPHKGDWWTFAEVLNGDADYSLRVDFGPEVLEELMAAIRLRER